ncbi:hypothetical protein LQZ18_02420 [Lachnospiraceae bacterium ZAX-1]
MIKIRGYKVIDGGFIDLMDGDTTQYRRANDNQAVKKPKDSKLAAYEN